MEFDVNNLNNIDKLLDDIKVTKGGGRSGMDRMMYALKHPNEMNEFYEWVKDYGNYVNKLYKEYTKTSDPNEQYELAITISDLKNNLSRYDVYFDKDFYSKVKYKDLYNSVMDAGNKVASDLKNEVVKQDDAKIKPISVTLDESGNPVIKGRVAYTTDDRNLSPSDLAKTVTQRLNEALVDFFNSDEFSNVQKINALANYLDENPSYSFSDSNLTKVVKVRDNVFKAINQISTSTLTPEEKREALDNLANDYSTQMASVTGSPISFSDMWDDLGLVKDYSDIGLLKLGVDTSTGEDNLKKAMDMYISNKSIYENAIKNFEDAVKSYTPENIEQMGNTYGDIESKYNAQKVDKQVTDTAKNMGQSDAIATQLGNQSQYQNYAENLANNQMGQMENAQTAAQNDIDNKYTQVQNAYNNASEAENAVMSEYDKANAATQAMLTQQGVDLSLDKYNYDKNNNKVQLALNGANSLINAANTFKGMGGNSGSNGGNK